VLVDSDDLLYPARVERARKALQTYEVAGCALSIIDEMGRSLGTTFGPPAGASIEALLPSYNVFGMSNSAYRSEVLRACLPIPPNCVLVDWLLATRAWAHGASMSFDAAPGMAYRQYGANTARVVPPFTEQQVLEAAGRVLNHYRAVMSSGCGIPVDKLEQLQTAQSRAETFMTSISRSARTLHNYVQALNGIPPLYIWWWCVAHPELEAIWKS